MTPFLVDSNILLDIFEDDAHWADWSETTLQRHAASRTPAINAIIYAEVSVGFARIEELEAALSGCGIHLLVMPSEALFLSGKAFLAYKQRGGTRSSVLPDFFIGAHAAVSGLSLMTRDASRYRSYFPSVPLIIPPMCSGLTSRTGKKTRGKRVRLSRKADPSGKVGTVQARLRFRPG